jgi:hypothetical protein
MNSHNKKFTVFCTRESSSKRETGNTKRERPLKSTEVNILTSASYHVSLISQEIPCPHICIRVCIKSFRTGSLERELQMVQFSAISCSRIAILWASPVSFVAIILCVASQRVLVVDFVIDSVRKLLDTPPPGIEPQNSDRPARSPTLYRMSYNTSKCVAMVTCFRISSYICVASHFIHSFN